MSNDGPEKTMVSAPAVLPPVLKPGAVFAGRYRVVRHMGSGSLCAAYLCRDEKGGEERVLKILRPRKSASTAFVDDFLFLAKSVARYWHPGIARVFDTGMDGGEAFYVMERVEGQPLRAWMLERFTFEGRVFPGLEILRKLISVFQIIHEQGCYGVLKPENVFLHKTRGPVVMDFGIPGFLSPRDFEFNAHSRRYLPYMGPELWRDWSNLVPQSDVFSLGAILYEILVGRPPAWPPKILPSEASSLFGKEVDQIVFRAMAANPQDRYATLEALSTAVERLEKSLAGVGDSREMKVQQEGTPSRAYAKETETTSIPATSTYETGEIPTSEGTAYVEAQHRRGTQAVDRQSVLSEDAAAESPVIPTPRSSAERKTAPLPVLEPKTAQIDTEAKTAEMERETHALEKGKGTQALERDTQALERESQAIEKGKGTQALEVGTQAVEKGRGSQALEKGTQALERGTQAIDVGTQSIEPESKPVVKQGGRVEEPKAPAASATLVDEIMSKEARHAPSPAARENWNPTTETLAASPEPATGEGPAGEFNPDAEEEHEPVPAMIWILLGVLAAVSCILGLMMGWDR